MPPRCNPMPCHAMPCQVTLDGPKLHAAVEIAFHLSAFDRAAALATLTASPTAAGELFDAAFRRVHYEGTPLLKPSPPAALSRSISASLSNAGQLGAMVHVLQHSAQDLAAQLGAHRQYVRDGGVYDPRFLVFEYMSGFLLRLHRNLYRIHV